MMTRIRARTQNMKRKSFKRVEKSGKFNDMQHNKGKKIEFNNGIRHGWRESYCSVCALRVVLSVCVNHYAWHSLCVYLRSVFVCVFACVYERERERDRRRERA